MKRSISPVLVAGTATALILLAVNMAFTVISVGQLRQESTRVQRSNDVLMSLQSVLSLTRDAETNQRGYVITGKPEYLVPYRIAVRSIGSEVDNLTALIRDEPDQKRRFDDVRRRLDAKLGDLDFSVALRERSGFAATQEVIQLGAGKAAMEALLSSSSTMETAERQRLTTRENTAAASYRNALLAGLATGAAALLGVVAFASLMQRSLAAHDLAEKALAAEAEKLRTTLGSIGDGVITTGVDGRITSMNAVAESLTGWSQGDAAGKALGDVYRVVGETSRQPLASPVEQALREGEAVTLDSPKLLIRKDALERSIDDSVAPIRTVEGGVIGAVLVFRDVSERKHNEKALRDAEARLRRTVMEMAVPTMAFADDGRVALVNDAWVDGTGFSRAEMATISEWTAKAYPARAGFMRQHIDALFRLKERVDSGERQVTTASGEMRTWHFYTAPIGRDAAGRRMLVTNAIDVTEPRLVEQRLRQSDERLRFVLDAAGLGHWELEPGGATAYRSLRHDRIFGYEELQPDWSYERFLSHVVAEDRAQVDAALVEARAHVGIWDVECRIVRADGAVRHIWMRASAHRDAADGSVRMLGIVGDMTREKLALAALKEAGLGAGTLPRPALPAVGDGATVPAGNGLRILVVEDNDDNADALSMLLEVAGHQPHVARTGAEALALAASLHPELVLLDIGLPDMSGYEVCRRLRELEGPNRPTVVAVTGWGQEENLRHSKNAGFDGHLVKPVGLQELGEVLKRAG